MKSLLFLTLSFFSLQATGQEEPQSLLHVSGQAKVAVRPTQTVVSLSIRSSNDTYAGTVEDLIQRVDLLVSELKKLKFEEEEIFTSNFSVNKNFVYDQGERKEKGFTGLQSLTVQFVQDKKRLLKVLTAAAGSKADPEISISFDLDENQKRSLKDELIRQAVIDAQAKAQLIAEQSNHKIAGIKEIKYGIVATNFPDAPVFAFADGKQESRLGVEFSNFEAANLTFSDQVQILFFIQPK